MTSTTESCSCSAHATSETLPARCVDLPHQLKDWTNDLEDDDANVVFYTTPAAVVQDRLELLGYTLDTAKSAFAKSLGVDAASGDVGAL